MVRRYENAEQVLPSEAETTFNKHKGDFLHVFSSSSYADNTKQSSFETLQMEFKNNQCNADHVAALMQLNATLYKSRNTLIDNVREHGKNTFPEFQKEFNVAVEEAKKAFASEFGLWRSIVIPFLNTFIYTYNGLISLFYSDKLYQCKFYEAPATVAETLWENSQARTSLLGIFKPDKDNKIPFAESCAAYAEEIALKLS